MDGKVLIVEDARVDRRIFRKLLKKSKYKEDFIFAWDAEKKRVAIDIEKKEVSINNKTKIPIMKEISKYTIIFIDLAWTKDDEVKIGELETMDYKEMLKREDRFKEIKGFALLDSLRGEEEIKKIVTTSFYSKDIAKFCREELKADEVLHKWADMRKINLFLEDRRIQ